MKSAQINCERIAITGMVQGVGFRPRVHQLAAAHALRGSVWNNPEGVVIEVAGEAAAIDAFIAELQEAPPPLAQIVAVSREVRVGAVALPDGFEIVASAHGGRPTALIPPDTCICDDCLRELFDPEDRRYLYPFINCTNCGPRFTIIRALPYDRPMTTMADFVLCAACRREYEDPRDRRFHAQPNACPACGPRLALLRPDGGDLPGDPILATIAALREGRIAAIKGLGGFHLAVDATNEEAVRRLRRLKRREEKPLAIMVADLATARRFAQLSAPEEQVLTGLQRPILLARRARGAAALAPSVAPGAPDVGLMLPYTPLHHLLFAHPDAERFDALVMTSGNVSEEPICKENDEARAHLGEIADFFLVHDRGIHVRCDDSVLTQADEVLTLRRRSRGFAPAPVFLPKPMPPVLALGAELKNTLCLTQGRRAFLSQHIGDLEQIPTLAFFREAVAHFTGIFETEPEILAYDLHPDYLSTRYLEERLAADGARAAVGVQHHHAHIAAVMAEHGCAEPVIGFALDGTGFGTDETIWGGEVLIADADAFLRYAHLAPMPLPGGEQAVRQPWRMALAYLWKSFGAAALDLELPALRQVSRDDAALLMRASEAGLNSPRTSSLGRLFDAIAALLGVRQITAFEGQAAMELEFAAGEIGPLVAPATQLIERTIEGGIEYPACRGDLAPVGEAALPAIEAGWLIEPLPLIRALLEALQAGAEVPKLAGRFHADLVAIFCEIAERGRAATGIGTVALSGGCFQNRILSGRLPAELRARGFTVLAHRLVPPNDGGLSLGQAYIAGRRR